MAVNRIMSTEHGAIIAHEPLSPQEEALIAQMPPEKRAQLRGLLELQRDTLAMIDAEIHKLRAGGRES